MRKNQSIPKILTDSELKDTAHFMLREKKIILNAKQANRIGAALAELWTYRIHFQVVNKQAFKRKS